MVPRFGLVVLAELIKQLFSLLELIGGGVCLDLSRALLLSHQTVQDVSEVGVLALVLTNLACVAAVAAGRNLMALRKIGPAAGRRFVLFLVRRIRVALAPTQLTLLHESAQVKVYMRLVLRSEHLLNQAIAAAHTFLLRVLPGDVGHRVRPCLGLVG